MDSGNIFDHLPSDLKEEVFEQLLESDAVRIERIISKGHSSPEQGWYDQPQNEWVLVLQGAAVISFEGGLEEEMRPGSYLNIPAHRKHRVKWTAPDTETIWLALFY